MKNMTIRLKMALSLIMILFASGCGYTTKSLLPTEYKTIYVDKFSNKINITAEQYDERMYVGYRPGIETDVTRVVIDQFLLDGNLKIGKESDADIILKGELIDFRKEPMRYDANDNVEEYRLQVIVSIALEEAKTGKTIWKEKEFSGETTYRTGGSRATSESSAVKNAISDLARRVVERTVEGW